MTEIDQLLYNLGHVAGLAQPLRFDEQGCARLMFDGHLAIDFERDQDAGLLQVYSVLGLLPAQGREALLLQLLQANLFGADTAGATLAIDSQTASGGDILLCRSVNVQGLAAPDFVRLVEQFVAAAEAWKERLATWQPSAAPEAAAALAPAPAPGLFLRA